MMQRHLIAATALLIILQPLSAAGQTSEQQELLAWAKTLRHQARVEQAMSVCDALIAADPGCVDAWIEHGLLALSDGRFVVAREDFIHALAHEPNNPMALVGRAHAHHATGDVDGAYKDATRALERCNRKIDGGDADAETWYIRGLAKMLLRDERAAQDFATAVSLDPAHMDARSERAHIYRANGRLLAAIKELTRAVEICPDYAVGFLSRGRMHYEAGELESSIADCDRALEINPDYPQAWHNRGLVNTERGDMLAAVQDLTRAIEADPDYASAHLYRGQAYLALGSPDKARADWERTRAVDREGWAGRAAAEMLGKLETATADGG